MGAGSWSFCDVGSSSCVLGNELLNEGFDAYCIDGSDYGVRNDIVCIPRDRYAVFDMRNDIKEYITRPFDIVTCFEMLEHVPKTDIKSVIRNLKHISKTLICSIHYNIKPLQWWTRMFKSVGEVEVIDLNGIECFNESSFIKVVF